VAILSVIVVVPVTESRPTGATVPIPTFLLEFTTRASPPTVKRDEKKLVELAVVAKLFVEVAEVVVEFPIFPFPRLKFVEKKFVELAVVAKLFVEVAFVVVLLVMLSKMFAPVYVPLKPKLKPMAPEPELYVIGSVPERDEEDILLLNIDQSVDDSLPLAVPEEKGRLNVWVSPLAVMVKSVPVVDVERVWVEPV